MRILWGFLLFFAAIIAILFGGLVMPLILGGACYIGGTEFIAMARAKGMNPSPRIILSMIIAFFAVSAVPCIPGIPKELSTTQSALSHFPILLTVGICASFFRLLFRRNSPPATIADVATTILGFIYVGFLPSHLILLRNLYPNGVEPISNPLQQPGLAYVWVSLFIIWATDVFAYVVGKKWGKHLLYPLISPKKTVEGAIGGFIASIFWSIIVVHLADNYIFVNCTPFKHSFWLAAVMGAAISIAAQLGDLCESMLKRDAGVKDSGNSLPGHGGFLDRGDSMLFGGAVAYYLISLVVLKIL
ncbi:MAG TPA: phosphatidate cytidylyltransferase [Drouetiella sp.]